MFTAVGQKWEKLNWDLLQVLPYLIRLTSHKPKAQLQQINSLSLIGNWLTIGLNLAEERAIEINSWGIWDKSPPWVMVMKTRAKNKRIASNEAVNSLFFCCMKPILKMGKVFRHYMPS